MKKMILAAMCCMVVGSTLAREVAFNVYYSEITKTRGELYAYAERYLGTTDVIQEDSHRFVLDKVKQITPTTTTTTTTTNNEWKGSEKTTVKMPLPLSEESMKATSLDAKAECVAKQIYYIRETRMSILSGDVEHAPADGKAMQLTLDELSKEEEALTSMFVGTTKVKSSRKMVAANVDDKEKAVKKTLMRFSASEGPLEPTSDQGDDVVLMITRLSRNVLAAKQARNSEPVYEEQIYQSTCRVTYKTQTLYEKTVDL